MEGRRPRKSLLMYDKVLFFSALLLFAFTLIFALDWIISGAAMNNADGFDVLDKVASFGKRTGIYFIFCVAAFILFWSIGVRMGLICCNIERYFFKKFVDIVGIFNGNKFICVSLKAVR